MPRPGHRSPAFPPATARSTRSWSRPRTRPGGSPPRGDRRPAISCCARPIRASTGPRSCSMTGAEVRQPGRGRPRSSRHALLRRRAGFLGHAAGVAVSLEQLRRELGTRFRTPRSAAPATSRSCPTARTSSSSATASPAAARRNTSARPTAASRSASRRRRTPPKSPRSPPAACATTRSSAPTVTSRGTQRSTDYGATWPDVSNARASPWGVDIARDDPERNPVRAVHRHQLVHLGRRRHDVDRVRHARGRRVRQQLQHVPARDRGADPGRAIGRAFEAQHDVLVRADHGPAQATVSAPNGGEVWTPGQTRTISWERPTRPARAPRVPPRAGEPWQPSPTSPATRRSTRGRFRSMAAPRSRCA